MSRKPVFRGRLAGQCFGHWTTQPVRRFGSKKRPRGIDTMKIEENEVYTTKEVAEILKVSLPTVKRMLKDKRLPSTRIGKQHRFLGRDLLALLASKGDLRRAARVEPQVAAPTAAAPAPVAAHPPAAAPTRAPAPAPAATRATAPQLPKREPSKEPISTAEMRQRTYMLGKTLLRDLFDGDGNLLFEQGCVVTEEMIELAKRKRKLMELFSNIEHED